jgi:hypothetical protein
VTPDRLRADDFAPYPAAGRGFAVDHLEMLRRLPMAICPSFLQQILVLDTSFPAEVSSLQRQCDAIEHLEQGKFAALVSPFQHLSIPAHLEESDWVQSPAKFITDLTAYLWSSSQIDAFRSAAQKLFAAIQDSTLYPHRLTMVVFGRDARTTGTPLLTKLRPRGVLLTALQTQDMPGQIFEVFSRHAKESQEPFAHWYVDGGEPWTQEFGKVPGAVSISYPALDDLRKRTLAKMEEVTTGGSGGAELMRARLTSMNAKDLDAGSVTEDPVLARFYTELFTESSGPQLFSTSFVQWTGRELARRAQPRTLLLRYAPRRRYQPFNEMLRTADPEGVDPEGSLRDAEMGAYYTWIEMSRIASSGKNTFIAWVEGTSQAILAGSSAPGGTQCDTALRLKDALDAFG